MIGVGSLISVALSILQAVLPLIVKSNLPTEIAAGVQAAIDSMLKVTGSSVTYQQLEELKTAPKW